MYKLLLCWRYLRTRYIALASIISVTLGVATMVVVNAVMAGFTSEMQDRIHGILSDVVFESRSLEGFHDPDWHMQQIDRVAGEYIEAMTATVHVPAMLRFQYGDNWMTHPVQMVGIDAKTAGQVSDVTRYLQHPENRDQLSWDLRDGGFDVLPPEASEEMPPRDQLESAGWPHRRQKAEHEKAIRERFSPQRVEPPELDLAVSEQVAEEETTEPVEEAPEALSNLPGPNQGPAPVESVATTSELPQSIEDQPIAAASDSLQSSIEPPLADADVNPFTRSGMDPQGTVFDPATEQFDGLILGIAIASFRSGDGQDHFLALPGDDVQLTFPTVGTPPKAESMPFTVVDFYESKMSEYDASFVFVPLEVLQRARGMIDPSTGISNATSIQIKLKDDRDGMKVRDLLRTSFPEQVYGIYTWRDKQGPLLAAVQLESRILNVLLFMIIAVAGFGILAIFFMIVVEKTRDVGVLKALGASKQGVLSIFLCYGMLLGLVGAGVGLGLGLLITFNINEIAAMIGSFSGRQVFDPSIYYFFKIPTIVDPLTVTWILLGAVSIAVAASALPARRAARMNPVEALRYE